MEKDEELIKIYNAIKDQVGKGSSLGTKSDDSYDNLQSNLDNALNNLALPSTWDDAVSAEISGSTRTGIESMITACKMPAGEIIRSVSSAVDTLVPSIKNYSDKVDEYNAKESERNKIGSTCPSMYVIDPKTNSKRKNDDYQKWNDLTGEMATIKIDADSFEKSCKDLVNNIKGLLSPIGSSASTSALSVKLGTTENYEGTSLEEFGYDDTYTISGTVNKDADGNIISETYYIRNKDGELVQSGVITYDENHNKNVEQYVVEYEKPSTTEEIDEAKKVIEQKGEPAELEYLDGELTSEKKNSSSDTDITGDKFETTEDKEETFSDGSKVQSKKTTTGSVTEGKEGQELVAEESHEEGTIETKGESFDYEKDMRFKDGKPKRESTTLKQGEQTVAKVDKEHVAEYSDSATGYDVTVQNETVTTSTGTTTTNSVTYKTGDDGEVYAETVQMVRNNDDPRLGSVTYADGTGYEVTLNEQGQYVSTEKTKDKNGNIVENSEVIASNNDATLTITNQDGTVTTMDINTENPLDQYAVANAYQTAAINSGYKPESANQGIHFLWQCDGSDVVVQDLMKNDPATIFSLKPKE